MAQRLLRRYTPADNLPFYQLFYQTVHAINAQDDSPQQLQVWADGKPDFHAWNQSFLEHITWVAVQDHHIVGFGDITFQGYLDRLFVHKDYQRQGIASALSQALEDSCPAPVITAHVSLTARPFFERQGYILRSQQLEQRNHIDLPYYLMEKYR